MTKLRVQSFTISIDGYGAGPNQSRDNPLGGGSEAFAIGSLPRVWRRMHGEPGGIGGVDNDFAARGVHQRRRPDHGTKHVRSHGLTKLGRAGGAMIRRSVPRCLC
jgi:hypothetical protein